MAERYPRVQISLRTDAEGPDPLSDDLDVVLRVVRPPEPYLISRRILAGVLQLYGPSGASYTASGPRIRPGS